MRSSDRMDISLNRRGFLKHSCSFGGLFACSVPMNWSANAEPMRIDAPIVDEIVRSDGYLVKSPRVPKALMLVWRAVRLQRADELVRKRRANANRRAYR